MTVLHRLQGSKDPISGAYKTRCGLTGWLDERTLPREEGEGLALANKEGRFLTALTELGTTCKDCKLKVTPTEKKILRLMYDNNHKDTFFLLDSKRFEWKTGIALVIYGSIKFCSSLIRKGLISASRGTNFKLSYDGKLLAATYPKVIDPFDKVKPVKPKRKFRK